LARDARESFHMLLTYLLAPIALLTAVPSANSMEPQDLIQLLRKYAAMTDDDVADLRAGSAVSKVLAKHEKGEIAVAGAIRIGVQLQFFLNAFQNLPTIQRGPQVLMVHNFSHPPNQADLQSMTLPPDDANALSRCSPGSCDLKLSAQMMAQIEANTASVPPPGREAAAEGLFRRLILEYVSRYLKRGNDTLITYADKTPPVRTFAAFLGLLREFDWLRSDAQPLYDCLQSYAGPACPQIQSSLYWSNIRFGLKPVFTVTNLMMYSTERRSQPWEFIALKQIYADHYFDGSLGLAILVEQSSAPQDPGLWVVYINRSLTDALGGWFGFIKRGVAEARSRDAMQKDLLQLKAALERQYRAAQLTRSRR
jgi:hypothetical protein